MSLPICLSGAYEPPSVDLSFNPRAQSVVEQQWLIRGTNDTQTPTGTKPWMASSDSPRNGSSRYQTELYGKFLDETDVRKRCISSDFPGRSRAWMNLDFLDIMEPWSVPFGQHAFRVRSCDLHAKILLLWLCFGDNGVRSGLVFITEAQVESGMRLRFEGSCQRRHSRVDVFSERPKAFGLESFPMVPHVKSL